MMRFFRLASFERWLWYLFLIAIPLQTRVILWQADAGFSEWRAVAVWGTDILMFGLFALAALRGWRLRRPDRIDWLLVPLVAAGALSLIGTVAPAIGLYQLARLVQYALFFLYLRHWAFKRFSPDMSVLAFVLGALLQSCIALGQSALQHDVGLRWLGETLLTPFMRGVAVFYDAPLHKVLRAYGTLPHPNILAMVCALALCGLGWLWLRHAPTKVESRKSKVESVVWATAGALMLWAFFLTYARTVIAVWLGAVGVVTIVTLSSRAHTWLHVAVLRRRLVVAGVFIGIVGLAFLGTHWRQVQARIDIHASDEAVQLRIDYARDALTSGGSGRSWFTRVNWTGVGIGVFPSWLAVEYPTLPEYLRQPAHSVYLLAYAETGVVGVLALGAFLVMIVTHAWRGHRNQPLVRIGILTVLGLVLLTATWDHFFWTLQQGRIMWWMVLALAASDFFSDSTNRA